MRLQCIPLLILLIFASCKKPEFNIVNLNNNRITALGHSGMGVGHLYPPDSYESTIKCLETGADGSELNVQMTRDCVLVVFHDLEMNESTNMEGMVNSHTWGELQNAHFNAFPYLHYTFFSLDSLFSSLGNQQDYFFTFDCKLYTKEATGVFYENFSNALIALIKKYNMAERATIESDVVDFLLLIQQKQPDYKLFYYPVSFEEGLATVQKYGFHGITINWKKISKEQVLEAHKLGIYIAIWNIHSKQNHIDAVRKNPDFIQSDKIEYLVDLLE